MQRRLALGAAPAALAGLALVAAGCGGGGGGSGNGYGSAGTTTKTTKTAPVATLAAKATDLGKVLVDGQRRTLYLFEKDRGTASTCTGSCASIWPPLTTGAKSVAGTGLQAAKLGSVKRSDGTTEVAYAGHPLYLYAGDAKPGDTKGQGLDQFGAEWYVLAPNGRKIDDD